MKRLLSLLLLLCLAACGGGGGSGGGDSSGGSTGSGGNTGTLPPLGAGESAYTDMLAYSTAPSASLSSANEGAAVTKHTLTLGGHSLAYTATAGHLIVSAPGGGAPEASMFYVAYTLDGAAPGTRPVTIFYNGGPGSATVWLHLGSFSPKRLVTGIPATTATTPFALVDNAESLLDVSDLVFVDAVGTGLSEAVSPNTNQTFWGVDIDAGVMRDFVMRWLSVNQRTASPLFLYGESYGGPRTAVLARALQNAGVTLTGLVLQSPALNYNSNCGVTGEGACIGNTPSYAATGAWYQLVTPAPTDLASFMAQMRSFDDTKYAPGLTQFLAGGAFPSNLPPLLAGDTGISSANWSAHPNLSISQFQSLLLPGKITGLYDARMSVAAGSSLASEGDPSSTFLSSSFATQIGSYLHTQLRYDNNSTYVLLSNAINTWNFSHAGLALPDTVPDLAAALAADAKLSVMAGLGLNDLVTPFHVTENDLARLPAGSKVQTHTYSGGHMSYLDDTARPLQKADLTAFYASALSLHVSAAGLNARAMAATEKPRAITVGTQPTTRQTPIQQEALQTPMRDPWVPPHR
ncbi:MAG TPA: peptidase S10 [Burkholderiaceae bacterium]|jgi:carboxypeptidase C (cathepsin A)